MSAVVSPTFHEVHVVGDDGGSQYKQHVGELMECVRLIGEQRAEMGRPTLLPDIGRASLPAAAISESERPIASPPDVNFTAGVVNTSAMPVASNDVVKRYDAFRTRFHHLWHLVHSGPLRSVCDDRLSVQRHRYDLHRCLNADFEDNYSATRGGGDIHSAAKVDICRIGTCMSATQLVETVRKAAVEQRDRVVMHRNGAPVKLGAVVDEFLRRDGGDQGGVPGIEAITAESLCVAPNYFHTTYKRFDVFEKGQPLRPRADKALRLLRHFLKFQFGDNGTFLADLVRQVTTTTPGRVVELELTVHGLRAGELAMIGGWLRRHRMAEGGSSVRFVIRIVQRHHFPSNGRKTKTGLPNTARSFEDVLCNIFKPLAEAAADPQSNPDVAYLLRATTAVSMAIDHHGESRLLPIGANPAQFVAEGALPPDAFFFFFVAQNVMEINRLLGLQGGASPRPQHLQLRVHAEANHHGPAHCVAALLLADVLINPVVLTSQPAIEYLMLLTQLPLVVLPSLNNATGIPFASQPLSLFHKSGLNMSIATLDPLHYHDSSRPLDEEYRTAAKLAYFSAPDLCEMALRSVVNSNMAADEKLRLVGSAAETAGANDFARSNVPTIRLTFRRNALNGEVSLLFRHTHPHVAPPALWSIPAMKSNHALESEVRFPRIVIAGPAATSAAQHSSVQKRAVASAMLSVLAMRRRWQALDAREANVYRTKYHPRLGSEDDPVLPQGAGPRVHSAGSLEALVMRDGVFSLEGWHAAPATSGARGGAAAGFVIPSYAEYRQAYTAVSKLVHDPTAQVFARRRLDTLRHKFDLHAALVEHDSEKSLRDLRERGDAYRCVKVDGHVHMASGVTGKELLDFMVEKLQHHSDDVIMLGDRGEPITLGYFFEHVLRIDHDQLSVAALDVQADRSTFNRFDFFNQKYNPLGMSLLRTLFLKTDNFMAGRYFAELIRRAFARQALDGTSFSEARLSVYGRTMSEWSDLARWFVTHGMSSAVNRWMVQIPRIYHVYRASGAVANFAQMLENIFRPLWEASINPEKHPFLAHFLENVSGFDTVDNENYVETEVPGVAPQEYTRPENPSYSYWAYHVFANIVALNQYRRARGLNVFAFRPHCGESGDPDHLIDGFLLAQGVNHGINLRHRPVLQYLYYLTQIGLSVTPLSNNALFCPYSENPFPTFFRCGMNVALATDGPLQFHHTQQPLIEEYGIAAKFWKLSQTDTSEIAVNSVRQSGFPLATKQRWLGPLCELSSSVGNDSRLSHVPDVRVAFRFETYHEEFSYLESRSGGEVPNGRAMPLPFEEDILIAEITGETRSKLYASKRSSKAAVRRPPQQLIAKL